MKKNSLSFVFGLLFIGQLLAHAQNCPRYIMGDSTKTTAPYSIYREFFKKNLYTDAYPFWREIYENAPAFRKQTFYDGADFYAYYIQNAKDPAARDLYTDTLFSIYTKFTQCFGDEPYMLGKQAMDLLKYGKDADIPLARKCLEKNIELSGDNTFYYYLQTYFKLLVNQLGKDNITDDLIKEKYDLLSGILDRNIAKADNKQVALYKEVKSTIDDIYTQNFVDKSDPTDCAKLMEIYKKKYDTQPNDLETIRLVYNRTKGCADSVFNVELLKKLNDMDPGYSYAIRLGSIYMKNNQFDSAFVLYSNAVAKEADSSKKADLYYIMAGIKADKNDFSASRDFARQAINYNPGMGKAYLLIGTLYAGSGKLCGPGTGFQSQIVLWPAFDYFRKAIEVGSDDVKTEAQKMISTYTQYLPTKAEISARKLSNGAPYTVKCWINEQTTVQIK